MMHYDYYNYRKVELKDVYQQIEHDNINAKEKVAQNDPHLSYLWFLAKRDKKDQVIANLLRTAWMKDLRTGTNLLDKFKISPDLSVLKHMPTLSFMFCINFKLQKPYISKDEKIFYILDNPVRKEKVFQAPMVAAASWKGALRAALWQLGYKDDNEVAMRLLGSPRNCEEHQMGRLHFFPTFFDKIGLEVINPHNRKTGVGERGPIFMECAPKGEGTLWILYLPFCDIDDGDDKRRAKAAEDLVVLAKGFMPC